MGRRKGSTITRELVVAKALEIIDRDGLEGLNIRKLGDEIGFNGASLYHHFKGKDEILREVQQLLVRAALQGPKPGADTPWRDVIALTVTRHRASLLHHPNCAPLLVQPSGVRSLAAREQVASMMLAQGVPDRLVYAIIDSAESLAYGSALLNPNNAAPRDRNRLDGEVDLPHLRQALRASSQSADKIFKAQLAALLDGWEAEIAAGG